MTVDFVFYRAERLSYQLIFNYNNRFAISCYPDSSVVVSVPIGCSLAQARAVVRGGVSKIIGRMNYYASFYPPRSQFKYKDQEQHLYLGRRYSLELRRSREESVKLENGRVKVRVPRVSDYQRVRQIISDWYLRKAKCFFSVRCKELLLETGCQCSIKPLVRLKLFKRYVCNTDNRNFIFSAYLLQLPARCIDYVIYHAICHMNFPVHSEPFYSELVRIIPWETGRFFRIGLK